MTKALFAASLITCFWPTGSITLTAMASVSISSASLMSPFCSLAVPVFVLLNATVTSGSSASAFSHPLCAIFQKSDVALVIKATVFIAFGAFGGEAQLANVAKPKASKQMSLCEVDLFMARVSSERTDHVNAMRGLPVHFCYLMTSDLYSSNSPVSKENGSVLIL